MIGRIGRCIGILFLTFLLLSMFSRPSVAAAISQTKPRVLKTTTQCQKKVNTVDDIESVEKDIVEAEKVVLRMMQEKQEKEVVVEAQNTLDDLINKKIALESALKWSFSSQALIAKESLAGGLIASVGIVSGAVILDMLNFMLTIIQTIEGKRGVEPFVLLMGKLEENNFAGPLKLGLAISVIMLLSYLVSSNKVTKFEKELASALKEKQALLQVSFPQSLAEEKFIYKMNILDKKIKKIQERLHESRYTKNRSTAFELKAKAKQNLEDALFSNSSLLFSALVLSREEFTVEQRKIAEKIKQAQKELDKATHEARKFQTERELRYEQMKADEKIERAKQELARAVSENKKIQQI